MDNKLKKLEDVYKITQKWDDNTDFYDPEYPSIMSTINLIARLEWTRRKLLEFNIPTVNASLPFRIMLTNYYANILVTSFPQLFGIDTEEVMYG